MPFEIDYKYVMWIYNLNNLNGLEGINKKILIKFGVNINLIY